MQQEQFTTSSQELIQAAAQIAIKHSNPALTPLHLLAAGSNNDFCVSFFSVLNVPVQHLKNLIDQELAKLPHVQGAQLVVDQTAENFFKELKKEADALNDTYISLEHFLLGWATTPYLPASIQNFFKQYNFNHAAIVAHMKTLRKGKRSPTSRS